jgi:DNA-binding response OmpR family regulator
MNKPRILIVEDDKKISRFLELELTHENYSVDFAFNGKEALEKIENNKFDLILLDIMIPRINGFEICKRVRSFSSIPIIMVTAKDEISDKVIGLDLGADDYLTKPFVIEELLARIRVALRKNSSNESKRIYNLEDLSLNLNTYEVKVDGELVSLSKKEFDLLEYLIKNQNIVLTREKILDNVWGFDYFGNENIVDVYIRYLRNKIDKPFNKNYIKTVRGVGYTIKT